MNGLTNAIKYSNAQENGPIIVRLVVSCHDNDGSLDAITTITGAGTATRLSTPGYQQQQQLLCIDVLDCGLGIQDLVPEGLRNGCCCTRPGRARCRGRALRLP